MFSLIYIVCAILQNDNPIDLAKIEASYHSNDDAKKCFLFNYNIYRATGAVDPVDWLKNFKSSDHAKCRFYEDDHQVFFIADVQDQKPVIDKTLKSGNTAKANVPLDHTTVIFLKDELIQYTRANTMAHIQMKKRASAHLPEATPINYGDLGGSNEFVVDALLRQVRTGGATVKAKRESSNTIMLQFFEKSKGLHLEVLLDEEKDYVPLSITMYDSTKDPVEIVVKSTFTGYERHQNAFFYPSLIQKQLIHKNKIVACTAIELKSITKPAAIDLKDQIDKQHSINVDGMRYSNMSNSLKHVGYEDVSRLYEQCEETSQRTLAAKAPKITSSRMPYVLTAGGLLVILLVYLYIRRAKQIPSLTTT